MPKYHLDEISRLDDIEAMITTTQGLLKRLNLPELETSQTCMVDTLREVRAARVSLEAKWKLADNSAHQASEHRNASSTP